MAEIAEDAVVAIPVREILAEQTSLLREIDRKVDTKADKADLVPIVAQLGEHHSRIQSIEDSNKAQAAILNDRRSRRRFIGVVFTAVVVPIAASLILIIH